MNHTVGNMWMSNDGIHNIMCECFEVFTHSKIGTVVRIYANHIIKENEYASIR
jgi:hypothetical protein